MDRGTRPDTTKLTGRKGFIALSALLRLWPASDPVGNATAQLFTLICDITPPSVTLHAPSASAAPLRFTLSWSGSDAHSGLRDYDVQYRVGTGDWVDWYVGITETETPFVGYHRPKDDTPSQSMPRPRRYTGATWPGSTCRPTSWGRCSAPEL